MKKNPIVLDLGGVKKKEKLVSTDYFLPGEKVGVIC